jgi:hypothetical protein
MKTVHQFKDNSNALTGQVPRTGASNEIACQTRGLSRAEVAPNSCHKLTNLKYATDSVGIFCLEVVKK